MEGDRPASHSRFLALLLVSCLASGCVRLGYREHAPAAGGGTSGPDAGAQDASAKHDASASGDASSANDADVTPADAASSTHDAAETNADAASSDASTTEDAATGTSDASTSQDASTSDAAMSDASLAPDAETDAGPTCTPNAASDYCVQIPALPADPKLDGTLDCGPSLIDLPATGWNSTGALPSDNHARYAVAWRPNGLYFYVEVDDSLLLPALASVVDPWCGDGIELYADADGTYVSAPDYDDPGGIQLLATSPAQDSSKLAVDARYHTSSNARRADWDPSRHISVRRPNGYALEAFVQAPDLDLTSWQLQSGGKIGFDIAINVSVANASQSAGCGYYLGQYYLRLSKTPCNADNCRPYSNALAFCTALLQ
jgi:hypothetical protein